MASVPRDPRGHSGHPRSCPFHSGHRGRQLAEQTSGKTVGSLPAGRKSVFTVQLPRVRAGDCPQPYGVLRIVCLWIQTPTVYPSICAAFRGPPEVEGEQANKRGGPLLIPAQAQRAAGGVGLWAPAPFALLEDLSFLPPSVLVCP